LIALERLSTDFIFTPLFFIYFFHIFTLGALRNALITLILKDLVLLSQEIEDLLH